MTSEDSAIKLTPVGARSLYDLLRAVERAKRDDPFARVVVVADHHDVATALRHRLGAVGMMNVTAQMGRHLANELAAPILRSRDDDRDRPRKPLTPLLERQAAQLVTADVARRYGFGAQGGRLMRNSLAAAFRRMQESPADDDAEDDEPPSDMNSMAEMLLGDFLDLVHRRGYYTPAELSRFAAEAVSERGRGSRELPHVIYYLPRRLSLGDLDMMNALLERSKCDVMLGLTGDENADAPSLDLLARLADGGAEPPATASQLDELAAEGGLSVLAAPDPEEEVRAVARRIVSDGIPFHKIAVVYRQDNPYASLLRQALDFADIPYSGVERRSLADTPSGLLLLGLVDMASGGVVEVERERFIEWITSAPVKYESGEGEDKRPRPAPASQWARLSRQSKAGGRPDLWRSRLDAHILAEEERDEERFGPGEITPRVQNDGRRADELARFIEDLSGSLSALAGSEKNGWRPASERLKRLLASHRWIVSADSESSESSEDRLRIDEFLDSLSELESWDATFEIQALRQVVREGLQNQVSDRGESVGNGVYLGPPAGIAGADYSRVYMVGMIEKQFPPRPGRSPWLGASASARQRETALERFDFLAALSSVESATLCWPAATAERAASYPSLWLIEAANALHRKSGATERLTYETVADDPDQKPWLTFIPSRTAGLRSVKRLDVEPADLSDYNLSRMVDHPPELVGGHPAIAGDFRMVRALSARDARAGDLLSEWDGLVGDASPRLREVGSSERHAISPSALETVATCPYKYFLGRALGVSAPDEDPENELSNMDRGLLVHKILERFVEKGGKTERELLAVADEEFQSLESRGATGYPLLWDIQKEDIRSRLQKFLEGEREWLKSSPKLSKAEVNFGGDSELGDVSIGVEDLGEIHFRGKIDRVDELEGEVRVRDFKTGKPDSYKEKKSGDARRSVANGRALQLPVYLEAARAMYPDKSVSASYCFPLADKKDVYNIGVYTAENQDEFRASLKIIMGMIRDGVFPATPEDNSYGNCNYCDFKRLCPTGKRQIWERKGRRDPAATVFNQLGNEAAVADPESEHDD